MKEIISVSGKPETNAGIIKVDLTDEHERVRLAGTANRRINYEDDLDLLAVGGDGIDGVIGANGRDGAPGRNGRDACQFSSGGNGQPGEDGHHGFPGTNGGPAGRGGIINIQVEQSDLALLTVVNDINVSAGTPGRAGKHGAGGRGGDGGRGGSSYSWQESYTTYSTHFTIDSHGHSQTTMVPETHYTYHSNPGGSRGRDGRPGGAHTYALYPGARAENGTVNINVTHNGATVSTHTKPFQLSVENVSFASTEQRGVWEPGETISAIYRVNNTAATMVSPPEAIPLLQRPHGDLELLEVGEVAGSIAPANRRINHDRPVRFKIKPRGEHRNAAPYRATLPITVDAQNTRLNRPFRGASSAEELIVEYPVKLEPQLTHFSIAQGESQILAAVVNNISTKAIGAEVGRNVSVEIVPQHAPDLPLISEDVPRLAPVTTHRIANEVTFGPHADIGDQLHYHANLYLQPIDRTKPATLIQQQPLTVQLTPKYAPTQNGFLLVVNSETSPVALKYWVNTLNTLAGKPGTAIWNTSYYGEFKLDGDPALLANTSHGTVVMLNNTFSLRNRGALRRNSEFLTHQQLLKAGLDHDVSLLVVGAQGAEPARENVRLENWPEEFIEFNSVDDFMQELLTDKNARVNQHYKVNLPNVALEAAALGDILAKAFPGRRYHVVADIEHPETLLIQRLEDTLDTVKRLGLNDAALINPLGNDINNRFSVINALPFSQKLHLFTQGANGYHQDLVKAMTKDLLDEQALLLQTQNYGSFWQRLTRKYQHNFDYELKKLQQLVVALEQFAQAGDFNNVNAWSPLVIQLIAKVQFHAEQHSSFWTRFKNWFLPQPNEQIKKSSLELCKQALTAQSTITGINKKDLQGSLGKEKQRLEFEKMLGTYIEHNARRVQQFFSRRLATPEELAAVKQLKEVCFNGADPSTLRPHIDTLNHSGQLKPIVTSFNRLYPELMAAAQQPQLNVASM